MNPSELVLFAIQNEMIDEVEHLLENAIQNDTDENLYQLSDALYQLGFYPHLKKVLHTLLERNPGDQGLYVFLAEIAIEENEDEQALDYLLSVEENQPAYVQSLLVQADLYLTHEFVEVAEQKLLEARKKSQDNPVVVYALAELYMSAQRYLEASHLYETLAKEEHEELEGVPLLEKQAQALNAVGSFEDAIPLYKEWLADEEDMDAYLHLGLAYEQTEEYELAVKSYKQLLEADPYYTSVYQRLAETYVKMQEIKQAIETIESGLKVDQTNAELYWIGAKLYQTVQEFDKAEEYFKEALELNPFSETLLIDYLKMKLYKGDYDFVVNKITKLDDEGILAAPDFKWFQAKAYHELEEYNKARELYLKVYPELNYKEDFLKDIQDFFMEEGNYKLVLEFVEDHLAVDGQNSEILALKEELQWRLNEPY